MATMTMQSIADLTQVRREVVSQWRARAVGSEHPFPSPLSAEGLVFDAEQVAAWLEATGRGNNPDAPAEVLLHSSLFDRLLEDVEASTVLLLLHDLVGGPLAHIARGEILAAVAHRELGALVPSERLDEILGRAELVRAIDDLAEAAFSGQHLLDRMLSTFTLPNGPWAAEALTEAGARVIVEVVRGVLELGPRRVDAIGDGGMLLATTLCAALDDDAQPAFGLDDSAGQAVTGRATMRMLAAHAGPEAVGPAVDGAPHLALFQQQRVDDPCAFIDRVESLLLDLGPEDVAVVIGPSALMVEGVADDAARDARRRLLLPTVAAPAPLRYIARLPKGLSRFGGRRRLAIWVFGTGMPHAGAEWTVYGEHAGTPLDTSTRPAIAADVAAALTGGPALTAHAFLNSTRLTTNALLLRNDLALIPVEHSLRSGGESLARIWELDDGSLTREIEVRATDEIGMDATICWDRATRELAREIRGVRLPKEVIGAPAPGSAIVVGPDEVREPALLGTRAIDRLVLETVTRRSIITAPGDVVFTAEGGAAAFVDAHGGHVLQAPVRALRCRTDSATRENRVLHPRVLAADIAHQEGRDRHTWRLRTVPSESFDALDLAARHLAERRTELHRQLSVLDHLEDEFIQAVASGTLAATVTTSQKEN